MAHPFQVFQHSAVGEMAIIVAVMAQAWEDLDAGPKLASHAAVYFLSGLYRHHLAWLGLPEYWLPEGFDRSDAGAHGQAGGVVASLFRPGAGENEGGGGGL
jgi:hypothetical protein